MWCLAMQMGSWTSGTGRPPSFTTELKHMTKCVSVLSGIHTRPPRSSPAAGMDRSNYGTKMKKTASETVEEVAGKLNLNFFCQFFLPIWCDLYCIHQFYDNSRFVIIGYWICSEFRVNFMDWYPALISSLFVCLLSFSPVKETLGTEEIFMYSF